MRWRIGRFNRVMRDRQRVLEAETEAARRVRLRSERELAVTEARRAEEIREVVEPLRRSRHEMLTENHVLEDIVRHLRFRGEMGNGV